MAMMSGQMSGRAVRAGLALAIGAAAVCGLCVRPARADGSTAEARIPTQQMKVDFAYAFGMPHRMTVALPDSSDKTLIDVFPDRLSFRWTYGNLRSIPLGAFMPLGCNWAADVWLEMDGHRPAHQAYTRAEGFLPVLDATYDDPDGKAEMQSAGGSTAAISRVTVTNNTSAPHTYTLVYVITTGFGEVPGYVNQGDPQDYMLAGWQDRADRVLALALGGETPLRRDSPAKTLALQWNLKPGESATGWLIRPYRAYEEDVPALRSHNWAKEFDQGKETWRKLLGRAARIQIPDAGVLNAYYACLGDLFIMREPVADGYIACSPGTEGYRCPNSGEASIAAVALDQAGLHKESATGYQVSLDLQGKNGDWNDPMGWSHRAWGMAGFKAWTVMEHYRLTGDRAYLEKVYPRMLACSRWQEKQRQRTRVMVDGKRPLYYGLMPRGQGDCGLDAGDGWYGYFLPHNTWAVLEDRLTAEAAEALGHTDEAAEVRANYERAHKDLLTSMREGAIPENGYKWIPGSPGNPAGSSWGALNAAFPCAVLPPDDDLITGTLRHMNQHLSKGGLQLHTGWMADGMWVAISLDNVAEVELARGNGDEAVRLLYACLNHGTPLYTWCEERGEEPGTEKTSGDRQHLWTPVAVARAVRDCMVMEDGHGIHLARGTARQWLASGETVGVESAPSHFGDITYHMRYAASARKVSGEVRFPGSGGMQWAVLHIRLPEGFAVKSVNAESGASVLPDGSGIRWAHPSGNARFVTDVR